MLDNILNTILLIAIATVCLIIYSEIKFSIIINFIVDDISRTYKKDYDKYNIKKQVYSKYGFFRFLLRENRQYKNNDHNVLYKKSHFDEIKYAYCIIGCSCTGSWPFSYSLFEHCEKRIIKPKTEHDFMHTCLNNLIKNGIPGVSEYDFNRCLELFCQQYVYIDYRYWEEQLINLNNMIFYTEKIRDDIIRCCPKCYENDVNIFINSYIEELKTYWDRSK